MLVRLRVSPQEGTVYTFDHRGGTALVGRDPAAVLSFAGQPGQIVSWHHAEFDLTSAGWYVSDLTSANGTFVNGQRIQATTPLQVGDQLRLGQTGPALVVAELNLGKPVAPAPAAREPVPATRAA